MEEIARVLEVPRKDAKQFLEAILSAMAEALKTGERIEIRHFGTFYTRPVGARQCRSPRTGKPMEVPAHSVLCFKPSKDLKRLLNTGL